MAGHTELAALFGKHHDLAIFRRFSDLNALNLLCMQVEITHLEAELRVMSKENRNSRDETDFEYSVSSLMGSHASENGHDHWEKMLEIRGKLREYSQ